MTSRSSSFPALVLLALAVVATNPQPVHSAPQSPIILGWGGSRLVENTLYTKATISSIVFPSENASDQEILARRIVNVGLNAMRVSFAPYCTDPNGFMSPYNSTRLDRAIRIGATFGIWIIVDYHGYLEMSNSTTANCWLNFWRTILTNFSSKYEKIIWEPLNEPMSPSSNVTVIGEYYQQWIDQARSMGDGRWVVIQNLCSFGCNLCPTGNGDCPAAASGYPRVTDPLGHVFISLHTYMAYNVYYNSWNNTAAESLARNYYSTMINGTSQTGYPVLDTEGGPGPTTRKLVNGTLIDCPDLVTTGAAGYCATNLHFIKTLTALLEANMPHPVNWVLWPAGDWSATPNATQLGAISPNSWGTFINWQSLPTHSLLISSTIGGTTFPAAGNYTYTSGAIVNVSAIPEAGYMLGEWRQTSTSLPPTDSLELVLNSNQNLTAIFSPPLRNIAVENISLASSITLGRPTGVIVTARNLGQLTETFNMKLFCNNTGIGSTSVQNLGAGSSTSVSFSWNTTGLRPGTYLLKAAAEPLSRNDFADSSRTIVVNIPSSSNPNNTSILPISIGITVIIGVAGFVAAVVSVFLTRRRHS